MLYVETFTIVDVNSLQNNSTYVQPVIIEKLTDGNCSTYANETVCVADNTCAWCEAVVVDSVCKLQSEVKSLPVAIYDCGSFTTKNSVVQETTQVHQLSKKEKREQAQQKYFGPGGKYYAGKYEHADDEVENFIMDVPVVNQEFLLSVLQDDQVNENQIDTSILSSDNTPLYDDDCVQVQQEDQCNAVKICTWCKSSQSTPSCYGLASSVNLPPKIFSCDKQPQTTTTTLLSSSNQAHGEYDPSPPSSDYSALAPIGLILVMVAHLCLHQNLLKALEKLETLTDGLLCNDDNQCQFRTGIENRLQSANTNIQSEESEAPTIGIVSSSSPVFEYSICNHSRVESSTLSERNSMI